MPKRKTEQAPPAIQTDAHISAISWVWLFLLVIIIALAAVAVYVLSRSV